MGARYRQAPRAKQTVERLPKVQRQLQAVGREIADRTVVNSDMAAGYGQRGSRYGEILVRPTKKGARVAAQGPFAHLDEFGSINNEPTAAMRRAAESVGKLKPR